MSVFGLASRTGNAGISSSELTKYVGQDYEMISDGTNNISYQTYNYDDDTYSGSGIPEVLYGGAHYSGRWHNNQDKLFTNYRTKQIDAEGWTRSNSTTTLPDSTAFHNTANNSETSHSFMQKASGSITLLTDSFSTVKISVDGMFGKGNTSNANQSSSGNEKDIEVNNSIGTQSRTYSNNNFGSNLVYQHKFRKADQTLSLTAQQWHESRDNNAFNFASNRYYDASSGALTRSDTLDQLQNSNTLHNNYAAKAVYTRRLSKALHLSAEYGFKNDYSTNTFFTYNHTGNGYLKPVDSLSNDYRFTVQTHITGSTLSYSFKKLTITAAGRVFFSRFIQLNKTTGDRTNRHFVNLAPQLSANFTLSQNSGLNLYYSGQTAQPGVEQLQPIRRSSNPLYVQVGNPNLKQTFSQNARTSYYKFDWNKGLTLNTSLFVNYTSNTIASKQSIDAQNRTISQYINTNGLPSYGGTVSLIKELKKAHLRPSSSISFYRSAYFQVLNDVKLKNENKNASLDAGCTYDLQNKISVTYSTTVSYNAGSYNAPSPMQNRTWSHTHNMAATYFLPKKWELGSDAHFQFQPKNAVFNSNFTIIKWNAYLQKKLLKNETGFIRLSVNDVLNDNTGYNRYVYGNTVAESERLVIKRYWLLTLGWNFSKSFR